MWWNVEINVEAYERKAALGGGFRGVAVIRSGKDKSRVETEIMPSQHAAWAAIFDKAVEPAIKDKGFRVGHYHGNKYRKNYFIA